MESDAFNRFSPMEKRMEEIEKRLARADKKILCQESSCDSIRQINTWDSDSEEHSEYAEAVADVQKLIDSLESMSLTPDREEQRLLQRANSVLQTAMVGLEEEFTNILSQNKQPLDPEWLSSHSVEAYSSGDDVCNSFDSDGVDDNQVRSSESSRRLEGVIIDLINPSAIPELRHIAELMLQSDYDQECCKAYSNVRKDALNETLFILGLERHSIEDVERMEWEVLDSHMKKWTRALKIFFRVILANEKQLCNQIFGELETVSSSCFVDTAKGSAFQIFNFGDGVAISRRLPEKLFGILGMYDVLKDLLPDIDSLFCDTNAIFIRTEAHEVLQRLGESVRGTFLEFQNVIQRNVSTTPFPRGGIHPLTKYVMNYLKALTVYKESLDSLLEFKEEGDHNGSSSETVSPATQSFLKVVSILESNLEAKSRLYTTDALQNLFLMNNIRYMVEKAKNSELCLLGEDWIRRHNGKVQLHATIYERASWNDVLLWLKDEGNLSGSSPAARAVLKDRFKGFNLAFEEIYKTQTLWFVPDAQLRDDLRISISLKVLQAYRTFLGRFTSQLEGSRNAEKYIKYSAEDLENFLLDLFEGSPRSLGSLRGNSLWRT